MLVELSDSLDSMSFPACIDDRHVRELSRMFSDDDTPEEQVQERLQTFWPLLSGKRANLSAFVKVKRDEHEKVTQVFVAVVSLFPVLLY